MPVGALLVTSAAVVIPVVGVAVSVTVVGGATTGGFTTGGVTTGGFTTGGFTTGGVTTGGVTTGGCTVLVDSPPMPTDVAPVEMGTVIGRTTWVPERTPPLPDVVAPLVAPAGAGVDGRADVDVALESPKTPTAVAPRLTGTEIGATT